MDILGLPQAQHGRMQRCSGSSRTQPNLPAGAHRRRCRGIESWALLPCTSPAVQTSPAGRLFPRQSPGRRECGWAGRTDSSHGPAAVVGCLMGRGGRRQGRTNAALVAVTDRASRQQQDRLAQPCASAHQALTPYTKATCRGILRRGLAAVTCVGGAVAQRDAFVARACINQRGAQTLVAASPPACPATCPGDAHSNRAGRTQPGQPAVQHPPAQWLSGNPKMLPHPMPIDRLASCRPRS